MVKERTYKDEIPSRSSVQNRPEYLRLVEWVATPTALRSPSSLAELAVELKVHNTTLSRWQSVEGFENDVRGLVRRYSANKLADIINALESSILKHGRGSDAKIWLEWHGWEPKQTIKLEQDRYNFNPDAPESKRLIEEYEEKLKRITTGT